MGKESSPAPNYNSAPWQTPPKTGSGDTTPWGHILGHDSPQNNPIDFYGAAGQQGHDSQTATTNQTNANRPDQHNAWGATLGWTQGPDGHWTQTQSFGSGGLGDAATGLQHQLGALGEPLDFSSLPRLGTGEEARQHAEDNLYSRAASRLDPQWDQREAAQRTQLLNQGLDPSSAAYTKAMDDFSRQRNDAYSTARNDAITGGGAEASRQFGMDLTDRQQMLSELLRGRSEPLQEMAALQGFLSQPGFAQAGRADIPPWLQAAMATGNYSLQQVNQVNQNAADAWGGLGGLIKAGATAAAAF